jgi:hypothetical protein
MAFVLQFCNITSLKHYFSILEGLLQKILEHFHIHGFDFHDHNFVVKIKHQKSDFTLTVHHTAKTCASDQNIAL